MIKLNVLLENVTITSETGLGCSRLNIASGESMNRVEQKFEILENL